MIRRAVLLLSICLLQAVSAEAEPAEAHFTSNAFGFPPPMTFGGPPPAWPHPKSTNAPQTSRASFPGWGGPIFKTMTTTATIQGPPIPGPTQLISSSVPTIAPPPPTVDPARDPFGSPRSTFDPATMRFTLLSSTPISVVPTATSSALAVVSVAAAPIVNGRTALLPVLGAAVLAAGIF